MDGGMKLLGTEEYMNLEIASRLVALRKENSLSQEMLAERLGISRQAVSKWERAEASPDTDNLIALAKLYHVSLDELLKIHEDETNEEVSDSSKEEVQVIEQTGIESASAIKTKEEQECGKTDEKEDVHVSFNGIHVNNKNEEVHVSWSGIHVYDKKNDEKVQIDKNGVFINGEKAKGHIFTMGVEEELPLSLIAIIVYIIIGICFNLWHPGWLIFLLVPVISTLINAVGRRNPNFFAYPVLALVVFLYAGLVHRIWHPSWVVFLTIPLYYSIAGYFVRNGTKNAEEEQTDAEL